MGIEKESERPRMRGIEATRGIAAIMVVVLHSASYATQVAPADQDTFKTSLLFLARGVDFFFVLSGFIITFAHWNDLGQPSRIPNYLYKRFTRIYPFLWAVVIPFLAICWVTHSKFMPGTFSDKLAVTVTSVLAIPSRLPPVPVVIWTLKHEVFFYLLFAVALWKPRIGLIGLAVWAAMCLTYGIRGDHSNYVMELLLSSYNLEFMFGVGAGIVLRTVRIPVPGLLLLAGIGIFGYSAATFIRSEFPEPWIPNGTTLGQVVQFGSASVLMILGISQLDLDRKSVVPEVLVSLGAASYSIYLTHPILLGVGYQVIKRINAVRPLTALFSLLALAVFSVIASVIIHLLIEKPLMAFFARWRLAVLDRVSWKQPKPEVLDATQKTGTVVR